MRSSAKKNSKQNPTLNALIKGNIISTAIFWAFLLILSAVAYKGSLPRSSYFALLLASAVVSSFSGGFFAVRSERKDGIMLGTLSNLLPIIMLLIMSAAMSGGMSGGVLIPASAMLMSGAIGGIVAANKKKKPKK